MTSVILGILLIVACLGWAHNWFSTKLLVAWLVMNQQRMPNDEETKLCANIVLRNIFRKEK